MPELYPNMSNADDPGLVVDIGPAELEPGIDEEESDGQWMGVKKWLAGELKELTQLWQVGVGKREEAHNARHLPVGRPAGYADGSGSQLVPKPAPRLRNCWRSTPMTARRCGPSRIEKTRDAWHPTRRCGVLCGLRVLH